MIISSTAMFSHSHSQACLLSLSVRITQWPRVLAQWWMLFSATSTPQHSLCGSYQKGWEVSQHHQFAATIMFRIHLLSVHCFTVTVSTSETTWTIPLLCRYWLQWFSSVYSSINISLNPSWCISRQCSRGDGEHHTQHWLKSSRDSELWRSPREPVNYSHWSGEHRG